MLERVLNTSFSATRNAESIQAIVMNEKVDINLNLSGKEEHLWRNIRRSSRSQSFFKIGVLKSFVITGKHLCESLFLIKLQASRPATLLKRDPDTGVFLWILRNFWEHLFHKTPPVTASVICWLMRMNLFLL